jgi:arylformamidase
VAASISSDGYMDTHLSFDSHLGTHIDAPAHMLEDGKTLDRLPLDFFAGRGLIVNVEKDVRIIDKDALLKYKDILEVTDFLLFKTGWSRLWGTPEYFKDFPILSLEALDWLLHFRLRGIGFDAISADPVESKDFPNHFRIFKNGLIIIENLKFPEEISEEEGDFFCFPLPFENADGSPVRAVFKV